MDAFSTVNILMNVYTTIYDLYEVMTEIRIIKAAIKYPLADVDVPDSLKAMAWTVFPDSQVSSFIISDGLIRRGLATFVFHERRLIDFNLHVFPKEWFKTRAIDDALRSCLLPYIASKSGGSWEKTGLAGQIACVDRQFKLVHLVRIFNESPMSVSVGFQLNE